MKLPLAQLPLALLFAASGTVAAWADCETAYQVKSGDTFYTIAEAFYGERSQWSRIYYANQDPSGVPVLLPGNVISVPCDETVATPDPTPLQTDTVDTAELKLLTGGGYAPFTDKSLPGQGMVTELVNAALELAPKPVTYSITWENDWSKHLFPLLNKQSFDMGFPWMRPDCEATPDNERCVNFHFSEPLMLMPIMLFVRADNQFDFASDDDVLGRTLCRPKGYFTHDLDRSDRRWLAEGKITFVAGETPTDCFQMVADGAVDAATVNLFLGGNTILEMGLRNQIVPLERPLSEEGLHVVISKRHWRGTAHLYRINAGLQRLKNDGRYQEIVSRHLELFRAQFN